MEESTAPAKVKASARYKQLDSLRNGVLTRARAAAALTIPSLLPEEGSDENSELPQPYQSLGARGVNNLASKLLLSLMPAATAFFRFSIDPDVAAELGEDQSKAEDVMRRRENKVMKWIERSNLRITLFNGLKQLIGLGTALMYLPKDGPSRTFRLDQFVLVRDPNGVVTEIFIEEEADPMTLPEDVCEACDVKTAETQTANGDKHSKTVKIYTRWALKANNPDMCEWWQEINDIEVPGSRGQAKTLENPYIVMRWSATDGETYGRGHVEEYIGDLRSLEGLSMAIVGISAVASKVVFLVHPNATTSVDDLTAAVTGDFVTGQAKDVETLQVEKFNDFRVANEVLGSLTQRLSHAFLLRAGTVRDAERVTAEEIRAQAQELEDVLGGVYTIQSQELLIPLVRRIIAIMEANDDLEKLPKDIGVEPTIVTGFDALGRGHELNRMRGFLNDAATTLGPQVVQAYVKIDGVLQQMALSHNVDIEDLIKDEATVRQEQQQQLAQQTLANMADKAAGPAAGAAVKGAADNLNAN